MNDLNVNRAHVERQDLEEGVNVIELMIALAKHKKMILCFPLIAALLGAAISFALPNVYQANVKLLPPQQSASSASALLSQLGGVASLAAGVSGLKSSSDLYVGILKSRTVADRLISKFNLMAVYDTNLREKARKQLESQTSISTGKDGLITIEVEDEGQQRVAAIANAYVDELTQLTKVLAVTEASQRRLFFERQLVLAKNNLAKAETALKGGLDSRGVISVDAESRSAVETIARLKAQISAKEIQLGAMKAFVTAEHPEYLAVQQDLKSLRAELEKLQNGSADTANSATNDPKQMAGFASIQLLRDVKYYQMLYELLAKQYEAARLDEAKDPAIIQVLDPAIVPERKFKPKRVVIVLACAVAALILSIFWALLIESKRRLMSLPATAQKLQELKSNLTFKSRQP